MATIPDIIERCLLKCNGFSSKHCTVETKLHLMLLITQMEKVYSQELARRNKENLKETEIETQVKSFLLKFEVKVLEPLSKNKPCNISQFISTSVYFERIYSKYRSLFLWVKEFFGVEPRLEKITSRALADDLKKTVNALRTASLDRIDETGKLSLANVEVRAKKTAGARWGERCTVLNDEKPTTYMVKQGKRLGETLAEHLSFLEYDAFQKRTKGPENAVAKTELWVAGPDSDDSSLSIEKKLENRVCVASRYHESALTLTSAELGGYKTRPKMVGTRDLSLIPFLIKLNKACNLGLEDGLQMALREGDFDLHTENMLLVVEPPKNDEPSSAEVKSLIEDLKSVREMSPKVPGREEAIIATIKAIQQAGGKVFFQKIDHGNSYSNESRKVDLDQHRTMPLRFFGRTLTTTATNHTAEWLAKGGKDLLFSDRGCNILSESSIISQENDIKTAAAQLFTDIETIAKRVGEEKGSMKAERYLLISLYEHISGGEKYKNKASTREEIQQAIVQKIYYDRITRTARYEKEYFSRLNTIPRSDKTEAQSKLWNTIRHRANLVPLPEKSSRGFRNT